MLMNIQDLVPVGVLLTFLSSLVSIYYTRKNLKTTKYIETITSERIKWLELIRLESSDLISNIFISVKIYTKIIQENFAALDGEHDHNDREYEFDAYFDEALKKEIVAWTRSDFIRKMTVLKLRVNPVEDKEIIEILDWFIEVYQEMYFVDDKVLKEMKENINGLLSNIQLLLKSEWEKIKKETQGDI